MPEGPEVKRMTEDLQQIVGKTIKDVIIVSGRYARGAVHNVEKLTNAFVERVESKGKLIVMHMVGYEKFAVLSTLGMTGQWVFMKQSDQDLSKHRRIELEFEDGAIAAFFDPRNFGTFKVVSTVEARRKMAELGPDILSDPKTWEEREFSDFVLRMKLFGRKMSLAEALLDQRICSGCGNYIRSDAMYLARLSPNKKANELSDKELRKIWSAMYIIGAHSYANEPPPYSFEFENKVLGSEFMNICYGQKTTPAGHPVEAFSDANGRTVWYSPEEQQ